MPGDATPKSAKWVYFIGSVGLQTAPETATSVCKVCGGQIVEVDTSTHRRACFECGKEAET